MFQARVTLFFPDFSAFFQINKTFPILFLKKIPWNFDDIREPRNNNFIIGGHRWFYLFSICFKINRYSENPHVKAGQFLSILAISDTTPFKLIFRKGINGNFPALSPNEILVISISGIYASETGCDKSGNGQWWASNADSVANT